MKYEIDGVELLSLNKVIPDSRGFFMEVFKESTWPGIKQSNVSFSKAGVVRGLHYQKGEHAQGKIVQVLHGKIIDVILDIRVGSPTFGTLVAIELTPGNGIVKIHPDLAHGFWAVEDSTVMYHCSKEWAPSFEGCINPMSEGLEIPWLHETNLIISDKDIQGQTWRSYCDQITSNLSGVTTGRFSCKDENPSIGPTCILGIQGASKEDEMSIDQRPGKINRYPGTEV